MSNRGKFRKSLYELCPLCNEKENNRDHAVNECRGMKEIREELRGKLRENFNVSDETSTWELIKKCYYGPEESYLRQEKK